MTQTQKFRLELTARELQLVNAAVALLQTTQDDADTEFTPAEMARLRDKVWSGMDRAMLPC
jgi:flagellar biosynthesis regulator FlaF